MYCRDILAALLLITITHKIYSTKRSANFEHISYAEGLGVEVNKKKAKHYYELSAMMGSVAGRFNCGF